MKRFSYFFAGLAVGMIPADVLMHQRAWAVVDLTAALLIVVAFELLIDAKQGSPSGDNDSPTA